MGYCEWAITNWSSLSHSLMAYCTGSGSLCYCLLPFVFDIMRSGNMGQFMVVVVSPLGYSLQVSHNYVNGGKEFVCNFMLETWMTKPKKQ